MSKDARECHTIPYYVTHVQFHPILCYIIFISLMRNVRSRKAKRGEREEGGGGGQGRGRGRGFPIIIFSRPNLLLAFSSNQLFLFVVLEKKKGSVSNLQSSHQGNDGKIYRENSTFPET